MSNVVKANPTKNFFISMITKDISLEDAIVELIDNSIDGAKRIRKDEPFTGLFVKITFNENRFVIEDNCGGISTDLARNNAFKFGREKEDVNINSSIGRFGIGMKRSLFKMGKDFIISSKADDSSFSLPVDVNEWIEEAENWNFEFSTYEDDESNELDKCGTKIIISDLNENVKNYFKDELFQNKLYKTIEKKLSEYIEQGISIKVNDEDINLIKFKLYFSNENNNLISPAYYNTETDDGVNITLIAGVVEKGIPNEAGWYIACNNRFIVLNDQTDKTVWGNGVAKFHTSKAAFRGFLILKSEDSTKLPWNTTKTSIDLGSEFMNQIRLKMVEMTKSVISFINKCEDQNIKFNSYIKKYELKPISSLLRDHSTEMYTTFRHNIEKNKTINKTVSYKMPKIHLDKVKEYLSVSSYKEVGIKTFEYFIEMEDIEL